MLDLSGEEEDAEDLTEMNKSQLNHHFKYVYKVSMLEDAREKIKELNKPHYESLIKSRAKSRSFFNQHDSTMDALDNIMLKKNCKKSRKKCVYSNERYRPEKPTQKSIEKEIIWKGID